MKMKKLARIHPLALAAVGVFLGRGAQADTILDFDILPADQINNNAINQSFGDYAAASSDGVTVVGFGTPNVGLTWEATGAGDARWDYYNDGGFRWSAAQLNASYVGGTHSLILAPNSASARVIIKSLNFHPYYVSQERFTYNVSVVAGGSVLTGPIPITFISDSTKNHPVSINYSGAPGQALRLQLARVASTLAAGEIEGDAYDIAVDDIVFAQQPETAFPPGPEVISTTPQDAQTGVAALYAYQADITNGTTAVVPGSIQLKLDGSPVSPPPSTSSAAGLTTVSYQGAGLLPSGSAHAYTLTYNDNGTPATTYTNVIGFTVANYTTFPSPYALPAGAGVTQGFT